MDCKEFNENIDKFIKNTIDEEILEDFIDHLQGCDSCKEELEIYFLVNKIFDEPEVNNRIDNKISPEYNLGESLEKYIKEKEKIVYKKYKKSFLLSLMFQIGNAIAIALAIYFIYLLL